MSKLKELEKRLRDEPENLGLRVALAGALHEAGRRSDAVELYRSVAIAYRAQGRTQQAVLVCRSVLEISPDDVSCQALLAAMTAELAPAEPAPPPPRPPAPPSSAKPPAPPPAAVRPRGASHEPPHARMTGHEPPPLAPPEPEPVELESADLSVLTLPPAAPPGVRDPAADAGRAAGPGDVADDLLDDALDDMLDAEPTLAPDRRSVSDMTPLPAPLPYHLAEPTVPPSRPSRPARAETAGLGPSPEATEDLGILPRITGIANAARKISASLLAVGGPAEPAGLGGQVGNEPSADEPTRGGEPVRDEDLIDATDSIDATEIDDEAAHDTHRRPRIDPHDEIERLVAPRPTIPLSPAARRAVRAAGDRAPERPSAQLSMPGPGRIPRPSRPSVPRMVDDEKTEPREIPIGLRAPTADPAPYASPHASGPVPAPHASPHTSPHASGPAPTSHAAPHASGPASLHAAASSAHAVDPLDSPLLALVPAHDRAAVLQRFRRRVTAVGTTVIRRGETEHGLVLVVRGRLDVHSERADGERVSLEAIAPGDHVGEISLLGHAPAAAYVVAAIDSELLVLAADDFYELAGAFPVLRAELKAGAERRTQAYAARLR